MRNNTIRPEKNKALEPLIIATIVKHVEPQRIILFGSRACGDAQERADYDIAIEGENMTPMQLAQIRADMETLPTLLSIDVVWMNRVAATIRQRILNEGKILYERQESRRFFEKIGSGFKTSG